MNWKNLKENKCPKCERDMMSGMRVIEKGEKIMVHPCGFSIRESRYAQIVSSQITSGLERQWEQEYQDNLL